MPTFQRRSRRRPRPTNSLLVTVTLFSFGQFGSALQCPKAPPTSSFNDVVTSFLDKEGIDWSYLDYDWKTNANLDVSNRIIVFSPPSSSSANARPSTGLHIIPSPTSLEDALSPNLTRSMTTLCTTDTSAIQSNDHLPQQMVHLHQDVWRQKSDIVKKRLLARAGRIKTRVFARKTTCKRIDKPTAFAFLEQNHLWGGVRAKHNYGLFALERDGDDEVEVLVVVASFGPKRRVVRPCNDGNGKFMDGHNKKRSSFELLRFSSRVDGQVVGGLGKLIKTFTNLHEPDDIVTVVDRDWGTASGWEQLGFHSVAVMPSLVMAIDGNGIRRHMVGAGIKPTDDEEILDINFNSDQGDHSGRQGQAGSIVKGFRPGLSCYALDKLGVVPVDDHQTALKNLAECGFFPVYDVGVERLILFVEDGDVTHSDAMKRWEGSVPRYAEAYYSPVSGIQALLDQNEEYSKQQIVT